MNDMKLWSSASMFACLIVAGSLPAHAACQFGPFSFFPDRNDQVEVKVTTQAGQSCAMAFKEGPGYRFTSASFLKPPPHGVLAKTGATKFLYLPFKGYRGPDSYAIKICAVVQGRSGCSSLTYIVDVR
ncbi:MAG: hypothetical protein ACHQAY_17880 [Hyphomicrobiales bacterium]